MSLSSYGVSERTLLKVRSVACILESTCEEEIEHALPLQEEADKETKSVVLRSASDKKGEDRQSYSRRTPRRAEHLDAEQYVGLVLRRSGHTRNSARL